jgi:hypothetical protein
MYKDNEQITEKLGSLFNLTSQTARLSDWLADCSE